MNLNNRIFRVTMGLMLLLVFCCTGCQITPRQRTLPEEIQSVYVPIFFNNSYEPGLEELATRATIEAFLADGRLDVARKDHADVIVQGIIESFSDEVQDTESDDWPMISTLSTKVIVKLYSPEDRLHPLFVYKPFTVSRSYVSDVRRMTHTIPDDAKQSVMEALGQRAVLEVLTGQFEEPPSSGVVQ